jgi:queuine tRNA-ribosyltransferase
VELSPERAIEVQRLLGSDIAMQLDECVRLPAERADIERAMLLSIRWAERSKRAFETAPEGYMLFGIVQGGDVPELRRDSARRLIDIGFHGYAVGGLAVGEPQAVMLAMIEEVAPVLPQERPRYLMGVGTPDDMLEAIARGIDMFDCVMPTRNGRHGHVLRAAELSICVMRDTRMIRGHWMKRVLAFGTGLFARLPAPSRQVRGGAGRNAAV